MTANLFWHRSVFFRFIRVREQKKSIGFGFRGWILIIVLFFGFMMFQVFTNFPLNILADFYGGAQQVAMLMTIGTLIGIVLQIIISTFVGKIKSIKKVTAVVGAVSVVLTYCVSGIPFTQRGLWSVAYLLLNVLVTMYALLFLFSARHIKEIDDKYREAAGKPLDDALVGRK